MTISNKPRVFLVDDHELIRSGIRAEIAGSVDIIGEADEVGAAIEIILERSPDVVLLDVHMPDGGGQAVLRGVCEVDSSVKFLALSVSDAAGDVVFSPRLAGFVLDAFTADTPDQANVAVVDPELDQLTARERQVLRLIARGYSYKDIAKELEISTKTVESHVSSVLRKLQLSSRYQLSHWASERHLF